VTLASERVSTALGDTARIVNEQLTQQRVRLDGDLQDQEKLTQEKATGIETQIVTLQAQLAQLDEQIAIQQRQNTSAHELLKKIAPLLAKGYVAAIQVQQQEVAALDAEAQGKTLARQRLDAQQQLATAQDQLRQLPLTSAAQKHDLEGKRAEIERALAENAVQRTTVWHAPKDGIVSSLFIKSGQAVNAGQILLAIVPKDSPLQAQLLVPSSAIGFIQPGDPVVLRYQAYPYQKFGLHQGRVKVVSRSAMTPAQVTNLLGQQARESLYRVDVELSAQKVEAYGTDEPLKPGMALEADILLDRRRLIEWVLEPLHSMGKKLSGN
jgi:membrane fusion protein